MEGGDQVLYTDLGWTYESIVSDWDDINSSCGCIYTGYIQANLRGMSWMIFSLSVVHTHMLSCHEAPIPFGGVHPTNGISSADSWTS
jgi:hypothetical protein